MENNSIFSSYILKIDSEEYTFKLIPETIYRKNKNLSKSFVYCWLLDNGDNTYTPKYVGQTRCGVARWQRERRDNR